MSNVEDWAQAYARQAKADFETWEKLQQQPVHDCHRLLFLQMTCEKLTKAHLCRSGSDPKTLQSSHAYIAKNLPIIIRQQMVRLGTRSSNAARIAQSVKHLAQEIELLAPAVRRGGQRQDNCEYPWEDAGGTLHLPVDWKFVPSNLLTAVSGRTFLKLIREAITHYA